MLSSISVITPSFNQGPFIERTIQSVLSQGLPEVEYAVCDGGSTDDTVSVLKRYDKQLCWVSERDGGQADTVNKGFAKTQGDLIGWLNSDDIYYPGALRAVLEYTEANPGLDVIYGDATHITENDSVIGPYPTEAWNFERLKTVCFLCQPAVFLRRRVVERCGVLNRHLRYCMDYEYWLRLGLDDAKFGHVSKILAGSRLYPQNKTLGSRVKVHAEINSMMRKLLGQVPDAWLYNYAHALLDDRGWRRADRRRYAIGLMAVALYASLRWNHTVPSRILKTTYGWIDAALK